MADIVIVEDDEIMGNVVGNALTTRGHTVELVTNGDDAAEVIRNHQPDLVVLDCALPGKPGMVVLKDLRESEMLRDIPVIVISARRSDWYVNLALNEGADDYVRKPFHPDELTSRVESLLHRSGHA